WRSRAACSPPPALAALIVVLAALALIVVRAAAPGAEAETVVVAIAARDAGVGRGPAHCEAALWLVVQRQDKLRAIVRLAVQRFVRDDDRGSRQCGRRDAIEHILRDADAVERGLGIVPVVDRDRSPAQSPAATCHRREHMRADRLLPISDRE